MRFTTFLQRRRHAPRRRRRRRRHRPERGRSPQVPARPARGARRAGVDLDGRGARRARVRPRRACRWPASTSRRWCPSPGKIICLGLNYFDHAKEGGRDKPDYPWFFFRGATLAGGARRSRASCRGCRRKFDYEAELAVVIGSRVPRHVGAGRRAAATSSATAASTTCRCATTRSARRSGPSARTSTRTGGFGPVLVTADELPPGATGLRIQSRLNGQVMQDANTDRHDLRRGRDASRCWPTC